MFHHVNELRRHVDPIAVRNDSPNRCIEDTIVQVFSAVYDCRPLRVEVLRSKNSDPTTATIPSIDDQNLHLLEHKAKTCVKTKLRFIVANDSESQRSKNARILISHACKRTSRLLSLKVSLSFRDSFLAQNNETMTRFQKASLLQSVESTKLRTGHYATSPPS